MNDLTALRSAVRGRVWLPGDPEFDATRRPWNLAIEQTVAAVVEAADADDVAELVRYAGSAGLGIATQPNGHGATGRTDGDSTILLRTRRLDTLDIDPAAARARVGAGVASGAVQAAAAPHGLTGLPGSSPIVSVTGIALGGGVSWFGRTYGWVADSVTAFDIVDAEGNSRHITADSDPDLFWALRGGGGDFAIVTSLELALHPAPHLFGGRVVWSADQAPAVLDAFRSITATAPDELSVWFNMALIPGRPPMVTIDSTYLGAEDEARDLLAPLDRLPQPMVDSRGVMSVADIGTITAEPTDPSPGLTRGELLTHLDDSTAKALLAAPIAPLLGLQIRHLGGAFTRPSDSPHGPLTEPYALGMFGVPMNPELAEAVTARQRAFADALPVSGRKPVISLSAHETLADAFTPATLDRLRDIKRRHNPNNLFRSNFPVPD